MTKLNTKLAAFGLAALALGGAATITTAPAMARIRAEARIADWTSLSATSYQDLGTYNSLANFSRSVEGTPCGMNCTREREMRWSLSPHP